MKSDTSNKRHVMYFLFRHLFILAFAIPALMWIFGGTFLGFANVWLLLVSASYSCVVVLWALRGARFITYIGLQAVGATCVSALCLLGSWVSLNAAGQTSIAIVFVVAYVLIMVTLVAIGARRWSRNPPDFLNRPADWQKGEYDLGELTAFYSSAKRGRSGASSLMNSKDRTVLNRFGWLIYLLLFLTPITTALIAGLRISRDFLPLASYMLAMLVGSGAVGQWIACGWFWKWERKHNRPMLVKQFAHRYARED